MSEEEKEAINDLELFEPEDLSECAVYRKCLNKVKDYINKLQKENEELKEKIENEIKELEENEDFYREHDRMYEYEGKINLLKRILAKE